MQAWFQRKITCDAWFQNKRQHASMVTKKGQHVMHGSKTRDNMASMVTKRYNMATLYMFWNFMTCEATRPSKKAYKYHGMPSSFPLQEHSRNSP